MLIGQAELDMIPGIVRSQKHFLVIFLGVIIPNLAFLQGQLKQTLKIENLFMFELFLINTEGVDLFYENIAHKDHRLNRISSTCTQDSSQKSENRVKNSTLFQQKDCVFYTKIKKLVCLGRNNKFSMNSKICVVTLVSLN